MAAEHLSPRPARVLSLAASSAAILAAVSGDTRLAREARGPRLVAASTAEHSSSMCSSCVIHVCTQHRFVTINEIVNCCALRSTAVPCAAPA
eukprot:4836662-Pyramimonas_sp.AAC.1